MIRALLVAGLLVTLSACAKQPTSCVPPGATGPVPFTEWLTPLTKKTEDRLPVTVVQKKPEPKVTKPKPPKKVKKKPKRNCEDVRRRAGGRSFAQVDTLAAQYGIKMTPAQRAHAKACLS